MSEATTDHNADDLRPPTLHGTPWLRLSSHLRTRRPSPGVLLISISNRPPQNALSSDVLSELKRVLLALDPHATRAVVLTVDPSGSDSGDAPVLGLGPLDLGYGDASAPPYPLALRAESALASLGFRGLLRRLPYTSHLSTLNLLSDVCALLRSTPQLTIAAMRGESRGEGCDLVLSCDLRVFAEGTRLVPGSRPSEGTVRAMRRVLGPGRSLEVLLLPDEDAEGNATKAGEKKRGMDEVDDHPGVALSAQRALALGLATAVVQADEVPQKQKANGKGSDSDALLDAACQLARRALDAGGGGGGVGGIKALLLDEGQ